MAKKVRRVDAKLERIVAVIEGAAGEMIGCAQDAGQLIQEINKRAHDIQEDLQKEKITDDEVGARYQTEIIPLHRRLDTRLHKILKNNKAITGMLGAAKALYDAEEETGDKV